MSSTVHCPYCGAPEGSSGAPYCAQCGGSLLAVDAVIPVQNAVLVPGVRREEKLRRVVAYFIDLVPMLLLSFLHLLPVVGWMAFGGLHVAYWLLRDMGGASPGKLVLNSYVGDLSGALATPQQRLLRNVPLAVSGLFGLIPFVGIFLEVICGVAIFGIEALLLLVTDRRLGDRLAGTDVFRR